MNEGVQPGKLRVRLSDLDRLSYCDLGNIFCGWWNLEIPREMIVVMDYWEIVAKYFAAAKFKRGNLHLSKKEKYPPRNFFGLIKSMDDYANDKIKALSEFRKVLSLNQEQTVRLGTLDPLVHEAFVNSFFKEYRPSNIEEPRDPNNYYDPNIDGHSKSIYVAKIRNFLDNLKS